MWFRRYCLTSYWCLKIRHFESLSNINHCLFEYRSREKYSISHSESDTIVINVSDIQLSVDTDELYKRTQPFINSNNACYLYSRRFDCANIVVLMTNSKNWSLTLRDSNHWHFEHRRRREYSPSRDIFEPNDKKPVVNRTICQYRLIVQKYKSAYFIEYCLLLFLETTSVWRYCLSLWVR